MESRIVTGEPAGVSLCGESLNSGRSPPLRKHITIGRNWSAVISPQSFDFDLTSPKGDFPVIFSSERVPLFVKVTA